MALARMLLIDVGILSCKLNTRLLIREGKDKTKVKDKGRGLGMKASCDE